MWVGCHADFAGIPFSGSTGVFRHVQAPRGAIVLQGIGMDAGSLDETLSQHDLKGNLIPFQQVFEVCN